MHRQTTLANPRDHHAINPDAVMRARLLALGGESDTRSRLNLVLPWVISVGVHVIGVVMAMLVTWAIVAIQSPAEVVLVMADFRDPGLAPVISVESRTDESVGGVDASLTLAPPPALAAPTEERSDAGSMAPSAPPMESTGTPSPHVSGESARFAGLRVTNARKIVYVVDASGSMVGTLPILLDELERSIRALQPTQAFAVIFFQRNQAIAAPPGDRLMSATAEERDRAVRWIRSRVTPAGRSNPLRAIELAIRLRPDAIFLLGHEVTGSGQFEIAQDELLAALERLNPPHRVTNARPVAIKCVQFLDPDPLDTLRRIAEIHGGPDGYRYLDRAELGVAPR